MVGLKTSLSGWRSLSVSLRGLRGRGVVTEGGVVPPEPYPAPTGFRWDFVTLNGEQVTLNSEPVVALVEAA